MEEYTMSTYNNSFVFYGSFYDAVQPLPKETRLNYLDKLLSYMTYGEEPVFSENEKTEQAMFSLVKPQIDKNSEKRNKGEAGGRPEITQEIKEAIIADLHAGITQKDIAEKYAIAQSTVASIKKRYFDAQNHQEHDYHDNHDDYHDNSEVYDNSQYHKPNANANANANDNDIPPEQSGGKDEMPILQPKPDSIPDEPAPIQKTQTIPEQAEHLARLLYDLHRQIDTHFTTSQKHIEQWAKDIEKLNRIDKRSYQDIEKVIRWIKTEGNFWAPNIISGSKLREKYPQIFLQMQQRSRSPPRGNAPNYKQQNFNTDSLPELFKQSRLEKPSDETAALDGVVF